MKFETYCHKVVKNHQMIFHKDPCTDARTRGVNCVRARFIATKRAHVCLRLVCAHLSTDLNEKLFDDSLLPYEYKSQIS